MTASPQPILARLAEILRSLDLRVGYLERQVFTLEDRQTEALIADLEKWGTGE